MIDMLLQAVQLQPHDVLAYLALADALEEEGRIKEADTQRKVARALKENYVHLGPNGSRIVKKVRKILGVGKYIVNVRPALFIQRNKKASYRYFYLHDLDSYSPITDCRTQQGLAISQIEHNRRKNTFNPKITLFIHPLDVVTFLQ